MAVLFPLIQVAVLFSTYSSGRIFPLIQVAVLFPLIQVAVLFSTYSSGRIISTYSSGRFFPLVQVALFATDSHWFQCRNSRYNLSPQKLFQVMCGLFVFHQGKWLVSLLSSVELISFGCKWGNNKGHLKVKLSSAVLQFRWELFLLWSQVQLNQLLVFINNTVCLTLHSWDQKFRYKDPILGSILDYFPVKRWPKVNFWYYQWSTIWFH